MLSLSIPICVFFSIPVSKVSKGRTYNLCIFLDTGIEGIEGIEENLCIFLDTGIEGIEGIEENLCIYLDTGIEGIEGPNLLIYVFSRYRYRRYRALDTLLSTLGIEGIEVS